MSPSLESGHDDRQLVRYVLGQLSAEETERLDELSITDDEVAWRLRATEDDLVDAYVSGRLEGETLHQFERFYLSSPRRREKVKFARSLRQVIDRTSSEPPEMPPVPTPAPVRTGTGPALRSASPWTRAAAAALVVASGALVVEEIRLRRGLDEARRETAAISERARDLERQLAEPHPAVPGPLAPSPPSSAAPALTLVPQTRAVTPIATLTVPADGDTVTIGLRLETNEFSRYQAALRDPATGQIAWRSTWIAVSDPAPRATVHVSMPAGILKAQHYAVELTGQRGEAGGELVASYAFEAVRR